MDGTKKNYERNIRKIVYSDFQALFVECRHVIAAMA